MKLINSVKSLGGEIIDLDISNKLTQDQINFINQSWDERLVLVFKKQNLDDPKLINFSKLILSFTLILNIFNKN